MDLLEIKKEYETTKTSFRALGEKYNISYQKIARVAKKEGWVKYKPKKTTPPIAVKSVAIDIQTSTHDIKELLKDYFHPIDNVMLGLLTDTYTAYMELREEVKKEGRILVSPKGGAYYNPKYSALQMEKMNLIKIQKELGVTVAQRVKLNLRIETEEEKREKSIFESIINSIDDWDDLDV